MPPGSKRPRSATETEISESVITKRNKILDVTRVGVVTEQEKNSQWHKRLQTFCQKWERDNPGEYLYTPSILNFANYSIQDYYATYHINPSACLQYLVCGTCILRNCSRFHYNRSLSNKAVDVLIRLLQSGISNMREHTVYLHDCFKDLKTIRLEFTKILQKGKIPNPYRNAFTNDVVFILRNQDLLDEMLSLNGTIVGKLGKVKISRNRSNVSSTTVHQASNTAEANGNDQRTAKSSKKHIVTETAKGRGENKDDKEHAAQEEENNKLKEEIEKQSASNVAKTEEVNRLNKRVEQEKEMLVGKNEEVSRLENDIADLEKKLEEVNHENHNVLNVQWEKQGNEIYALDDDITDLKKELDMLERQCQDATDALLQERKERKKMEARLQQLRQDTKVAKPLK